MPAAVALPTGQYAPAAQVQRALAALPPIQKRPTRQLAPAAAGEDAGQYAPGAHVHGAGCATPPVQYEPAGHATPLTPHAAPQ